MHLVTIFSLFLASFVFSVHSFESHKFKQCHQSSFCQFHRSLSFSAEKIAKENVKMSKNEITVDMVGKRMRICLGKLGEIRIIVDDGKGRHIVRDVLSTEYDIFAGSFSSPHSFQEIPVDPLSFSADNGIVVRVGEDGWVKVEKDQRTLFVVNGRGRMKMEPRGENPSGENFEESFGGSSDSRPHGRQSVGVDVSFVGAEHVFGIPEHATGFPLRNTVHAEPFRLYNLDVFEYESDSNFGLYGSVPFMMSHSSKGSTGMLFLNSAEMYIDIGAKNPEEFVFNNDPAFAKRIDTHWFAESGLIDLTFFLGPSPKQVYKQYSILTGPPQLPPLFSLGYHQCRWNYKDEPDVEAVNNGFNEHNIPMDVIWLDIEHTNGKRYFTWDAVKFPHPEQMQQLVGSSGRRMVTIVDPHIKRDNGYHVHSEATSNGYYIKRRDGGDFDGHCWPGSSSYLDFTESRVREWWSSLFGRYPGATKNLYTWIDMNEPSVFSGPEVTAPKDLVHLDGTEHRDVHNVYGFFNHMAAYEGGLKLRTQNDRPFVLSRSFFSGSQRYGAIWTGDNKASWDHLAVAVPMLLSLNVAGIVFSGADVGGFFGNPDTELLVRWYQAAAFQPFFRGHAHIDTKRREPWLFGEPTTALIREAIALRYAILPYVYTCFWEAYRHRGPVMRPLWFEFPSDPLAFAVQDAFMLGSSIYVKPVVTPGQDRTTVYLPSPTSADQSIFHEHTGFASASTDALVSIPWYEYETGAVLHSGTPHEVTTPLRKIPVYLRGGSMIIQRLRRRRSSLLMSRDPYSLLFALDEQGRAVGHAYFDDGETFDFSHAGSAYSYRSFRMRDNRITNKRLDGSGKYTLPTLSKVLVAESNAAADELAAIDQNAVHIERIVIYGVPERRAPSRVMATLGNGQTVQLSGIYDATNNSLTIKGSASVKIESDWEIDIQY